MARPTKGDSKKLSAVLPPVRCTENEKLLIRQNSKKVGLSMSEYLRRMAVNGEIKIHQSSMDFEVTNQLRKIGINLNQQTKHFNASGKMPLELKVLWRKLDALISQITESL